MDGSVEPPDILHKAVGDDSDDIQYQCCPRDQKLIAICTGTGSIGGVW
jgi:hypothetical protein